MLKKSIIAAAVTLSTAGGGIFYIQNRSVKAYTTSDNIWDYNWDKREIYELINAKKLMTAKSGEENELETLVTKNTPKAVRRLIFIRHGQYETNATTDKDRILTDLGIKQAILTGQRLKNQNLKVSRIVQSSMTRAQQTCSLISKNFPDVEIETSDLLSEGAPIPPVPKKRDWEPELKYFSDSLRIESAFRKFLHRADAQQTEDSCEIIIGHANVIRYFVCRSLQFPPEGWLRISLKHGSMTMISILPNGEVVLNALGDAGHLPKDMLTTT